MNCPQVTITVWGDFALFSRPEGKVERITYPVPTPSAVRGMLASIYSKPAEFYWQVQRIEVLKNKKAVPELIIAAVSESPLLKLHQAV